MRSGIIDFIKLITKTVLGELESNPINTTPINPDKDNYSDIDNKEYLKWFKNKLDDYKYYIIITSIVVIGGTIIYLYWDSFTCSWRRRVEESEPFLPLPTDPENNGPTSGTIPSPDSSSSGDSFNRYFRTPILEKLAKFKRKLENLLKENQLVLIQLDLYLEVFTQKME